MIFIVAAYVVGREAQRDFNFLPVFPTRNIDAEFRKMKVEAATVGVFHKGTITIEY